MPVVQPIDIVALAAVILGCLSFLIPIAGLTARFAIKPIVEAMKMGREGSMDRQSVQLLERRLALLEQEVHGVAEMRADLSRVLEELDFRKQLTESREGADVTRG